MHPPRRTSSRVIGWLTSFVVALGFVSTEASARDWPAECQQVIDRYVSGVTPKTLTPLSRHSALYVYRNGKGGCGWGSGNNQATAAAARQVGLRHCKEYQTKAAGAGPCTLVAVNGRAGTAAAGRPSPATTERPASAQRASARGKAATASSLQIHCMKQVGGGIDPVTKRWMFFTNDRDAMSKTELYRMCLAGGDRAKANTIPVRGYPMSHPGDRGPTAR